MSDIAIRLQNVSKTFEIYKRPSDRLKQIVWGKRRKFYDEFQAIRNISLEIYRGETVGVVGRNGAGKSTLLQIICGTLTPSAGQVITKGRIVALTLGSGFNPEFSGHENIFMNGTILGLTRKELEAQYDSIVRFADIGNFIHRPVKCYSSGMKSRLAFAVAIHVDPDILIIDESLSVGDAAFRRKCFARLEELRQSEKTILFVSHAAGQIVGLCDRAILLDCGEQLLAGTPRIVMNYYQRLIDAPADQAAEIRHEILKLAADMGTTTNTADTTNASIAPSSLSSDLTYVRESHQQSEAPLVPANLDRQPITHKEVTEPIDRFDPNLKPKSTVEHAGRAAKIQNVQILNQQGKSANILAFGQQYICTYSVRLLEPAYDIYCGMSIKTTNGIQVSGILTHEIPYADADSTLEVNFDFQAILRPGIYFLNAKVMGKEEQGSKVLHRIVDVIMFRIQPIPQKRFQGYVDISNRTPGTVNVFESVDSFAAS